jgi:hypothetical protein
MSPAYEMGRLLHATPISPRYKDPQIEMLARRPIAHGTLEL